MTVNQITHDQATKLAAFINALRPDWDKPGVIDALGRARGKGSATAVAIAAIKAASSPTNRTPAVLHLDGEHWRTRPETNHQNTATPPKRSDWCPMHIGELAHNCRACAADRLAAP